jgi:hypothetical protein
MPHNLLKDLYQRSPENQAVKPSPEYDRGDSVPWSLDTDVNHTVINQTVETPVLSYSLQLLT